MWAWEGQQEVAIHKQSSSTHRRRTSLLLLALLSCPGMLAAAPAGSFRLISASTVPSSSASVAGSCVVTCSFG